MWRKQSRDKHSAMMMMERGCFFLFASTLACASAFFIGTSLSGPQKHRCLYLHSSIESPFSKQHAADEAVSNKDATSKDENLSRLCKELKAEPSDLLRIESTPDGVRGVYVNRALKEGDLILDIPLASCLIDSKPPSWLVDEEIADDNSKTWTTRLAASLIDLKLRLQDGVLSQGQELWLSLLPDEDLLRASLPIHWPEETLQNARCMALELAVDSSFFLRGEATEDLKDGLDACVAADNLTDDVLQEMCSNALDLVQTRSRKFTNSNVLSGKPLHVVAPILDLINHGSINCSGESGANAKSDLECDDGKLSSARIVVRATSTIRENQEVLEDYGEAARPAWNCLQMYGFVPRYNRIPGPGEPAAADDDDGNLAEIFLNGVRYEVSPSTIPLEMATAISSSSRAHSLNERAEDDLEGNPQASLSGEGALRIARRLSDVAYHLLLEPEQDLYDDHPAATPTPFQVISSKLAASLRWSQHRILLACAFGLREFAADEDSFL